MNKRLKENLNLLSSKDKQDYISEYEKIDKEFTGSIGIYYFWRWFIVFNIFLWIVVPLWKLAYPQVLPSIMIILTKGIVQIGGIIVISGFIVDIVLSIIKIHKRNKLFRKYFKITIREDKNGIQKSRTSKRTSSSSKKAI